MPEVSVLMTVRNGEKYLAEAIESVLAQSFKDFELVIVDDASTDQTVSILKRLTQKDQRIRLVVNKKRVGRPQGLNQGIKLCQGKFIAIIDSDDIWCDQNKLTKQTVFLNSNPDYGIVGTNIIRIDENGQKIDQLRYQSTDQGIRKLLLSSNQFAHPSVLIRKKVFEQVGLYSEQKKHWHVEDYEFFLRAGRRFKLANLPEYCVKYRINAGGLAISNEYKLKREGLRLAWEYRHDFPGQYKALALKSASLFLPRKYSDYLFSNNRLFRRVYPVFSGVRKNN